MSAKLAKPGHFQFEWGNSELAKHIVQAELALSLDDVGQLSVSVAIDGAQAKALAPKDLPQEVTFSWQERGFFKGQLVSGGLGSSSRLSLVFQDGLAAAHKTHDNQYMKEPTLRECLERLCTKIDLAPKFIGSFSEKVPV